MNTRIIGSSLNNMSFGLPSRNHSGWGEILIVTVVLAFVSALLLFEIMRIRTDNQKEKKGRGKN